MQAYADLNLTLGLDLSDPTDPKPFIDDASGVTLGLKAAATDLQFSASAGPFGLFIGNGTNDGTVTFGDPNSSDGYAHLTIGLKDFDGSGIHDLIGTGALGQIAKDFQVAVTGSAVATLPIYAPTESIPLGLNGTNNLVVTIGDLEGALQGKAGSVNIQSPNFSSLGLPNIIQLINNPSVLLNGLDSILGTLQSGLNSQVTSQIFGDVPLIGSHLQDAVQFVQSVRTDVIQQLSNALGNLSGPQALQDELYTLLEPTGLLYSADDSVQATDPMPDDTYPPSATTANPITNAQEFLSLYTDDQNYVELRLHLHQAFSPIPNLPLSFDIGLPGLGLSLNGATPTLNLGWDFNLGLRLDTTNGLSLITNSNPAGAPDDVFKVTFNVGLSNTTLTGQIGFLQLSATTDPRSDHPTDVSGGFGVKVDAANNGDIADPLGGDLIPVTKLLAGLTFTPIYGAQANVNLDLTAGFGQGMDFPTITTVLHVGWGFGNTTDPNAGFPVPDADHPTTPDVEFQDVSLNLGSFISGFVAPIVQQVKTYLDPIAPIVEVLTARLPLISDLTGQTVTLADLAGLFGYSQVTTFTDAFQAIYSLVNSLPTDGGNINIDFGTLNFSNTAGLTNPFGSTPESLPSDEQSADVGSVLSKAGASQEDASFAHSVTHTADFKLNFPLLSSQAPQILFGLLTGKTEDLFQFDMTTLQLGFNYRAVFPILWPLSATLDGSVSATLHFSFGYDTKGVQEAIQDKNDGPAKIATDLLDGFYIDTNPANGPQISITGGIAAGVALSLEAATAGVEGGIFATINAALLDVSPDHKLRFGDIYQLIHQADGSINPLGIFDISGQLAFRLYAYVSLEFPPITFSQDIIPPVTLLSFDYVANGTPVLATQTTNSIGQTILTLNMGPNAGNRKFGDTSDDNESFKVIPIQGDTNAGDVDVEELDGNGNVINGPTGKPLIQPYYGNSEIVANGGQGNNRIELDGINTPASIIAGTGNSAIIINGGTGEDTLSGGPGNDSITADGNNDIIAGGTGNTTITASGNNDTVSTGPGGGTITASGNNDSIIGGSGTDIINATGNNDTITGGAGANTINASGSADTLAESGFSTYTLTPGYLTYGPGNADYQTTPITNIVLTGGAAPTTFNLSGWTTSGTGVSLGAGSGGATVVLNNSQLPAQDSVHYTLSNSALVESIPATGQNTTFRLSGITHVVLDGGHGNDLFDVNGYTGTVTLSGGGGNDTFTVESTPATLPNVTASAAQGSASSLTVTLSNPPAGQPAPTNTNLISSLNIANVTLDDTGNLASTWTVRGEWRLGQRACDPRGPGRSPDGAQLRVRDEHRAGLRSLGTNGAQRRHRFERQRHSRWHRRWPAN